MGIRDNDIERARQNMYIPVWQFQGFEESSDTLGSAGTSNPLMLEWTTTGLVGLEIDTTGSLIHHVMGFPSFWDIEEEIGVRVWWAAVGHSATTDAVTWLVEYDTVASGSSMGPPSTALDTAITDQEVGSVTTRTIVRGNRGIINAHTFAPADLDSLFVFEVEADAVTTFTLETASELYLMGINFDYMPKLAVGGQNYDRDARL